MFIKYLAFLLANTNQAYRVFANSFQYYITRPSLERCAMAHTPALFPQEVWFIAGLIKAMIYHL